MNTNTALNAYTQHSLSIEIQTSSGDKIELDFNNEKSLQYSSKGGEKSFSFSSLESFSFHYEGDGIDAQDAKEIEKFLKIAQPKIDNFVAGLKDGSSLKKPISELASGITNNFQSIKEKNDDNLLNFTKNSIVNSMDKAFKKELNPLEQTEDIISNAQRFLDQIFEQLDKTEQSFYA